MNRLKQFVKLGFRAVAPRLAVRMESIRARAYSQRLVKEWGLYDLNQKLISDIGTQVISSPFAGLRLTPMTLDEHIGPYLLGTYEAELHPWWDEILQRPYRQIVDIGSKFGYYAVGLGMRQPQAASVAFDTDPWARAATREMAEANGLADVEILSYCSPGWFETNLVDGALIVSDCEGYEGHLFPRIRTPALNSATLVIELHEALAPGTTEAIKRRFANTHAIRTVTSGTEHPLPDGIRTALEDADLRRVAQEVRPPQEWMLLQPG